MDRRDGDPPVLAGGHLLGVQPGGVLEEAGERRVLVVLVGERLRGAAQRAQVLEHAVGVAALVGPRRAVAPVLVVAHEPAVERDGGDHDVAERAAGGRLGADPLEL